MNYDAVATGCLAARNNQMDIMSLRGKGRAHLHEDSCVVRPVHRGQMNHA